MKFLTRYRFPIAGITTLIATEILLRTVLGLGNPVLFMKDAVTGYRFKPNQLVTRFGKRLEYNQHSQRSPSISPEKPQGTLRILMVGDSVLNGGNPIDQSETTTQLLQNKIQATGQAVEVLNASASGWAVGNQLGYLQKFGTFHSDLVILLISSHNLIQPPSTGDRVGQNPFYPDHPPVFALQEVFERYLQPNLQRAINAHAVVTDPANPAAIAEPTPDLTAATQQFQQNLKLLQNSIALVQSQKAAIDILFIPNRRDIIPSTTIPRYKPELLQFLNTLKVPVFDAQKNWSNLPAGVRVAYYRDVKHLTEKGNEAVADFVFQRLCASQQLKPCGGRARGVIGGRGEVPGVRERIKNKPGAGCQD